MSAPVDVLAVLDKCAYYAAMTARRYGGDVLERHAEQISEARDATYNLIKAVDRLERKSVYQARLTSSAFNSDLEKVRAALARVQGGAR